MRRDNTDFHELRSEHEAIHARLEQWARWVRVRPRGWFTQPMFRLYKSKAWQWETPEPKVQIDTLDAQAVEKAVGKLPRSHMWAIRWCYVFRGNPAQMARALGVTLPGLMKLVHQGRTILGRDHA